MKYASGLFDLKIISSDLSKAPYYLTRKTLIIKLSTAPMCRWNDTTIVNINNHPIAIDRCIARLVEVLSEAGLETVASCCGHGKRPSNIALADSREIIIAPDYETGRRIDQMFPPIN
jgi:hypothetical protein